VTRQASQKKVGITFQQILEIRERKEPGGGQYACCACGRIAGIGNHVVAAATALFYLSIELLGRMWM
jgi:hypothetical protein